MPNAADESLPRASLLAYFRDSQPPAYVDVAKDTQHSLRPCCEAHEDLEQHVYLGEYCPLEDSDEGYATWGWDEVVHAIVQAALIVIIVLNVDIFLSRWDMGVINWRSNAPAHSTDVVQVSLLHSHHQHFNADRFQVHFCLSNTAHAHHMRGQQVWRILSADAVDQCDTGNLTMMAPLEEVVKLGLLDEIVMDMDIGNSAENLLVGSDTFRDETMKLEEAGGQLPDDLAQEGEVRQPVTNYMHAGFGGRWDRRI